MVQANEGTAGPALRSRGLHRHLRGLLREGWRDFRSSFRRCRARFCEDSVHQLRVDSRRLLALLSLLPAFIDEESVEPARRRLKRLLNRFSKLRDTQMQLLAAQRWRRAFPEVELWREALRKRERRLIRRADEHLRDARLGRIEQAVARVRARAKRALRGNVREGAHAEALLRAVNEAFAEAGRRRRRCLGGDIAAIHRFRVAFKKFRYTVEPLHPLLPGVSRARIKAMRAFQDRAGHIQDADTILAALDKFRRKDPRRARLLGPCHRAVVRQRARLVDGFLRQAHRLDGFWPPPAL